MPQQRLPDNAAPVVRAQPVTRVGAHASAGRYKAPAGGTRAGGPVTGRFRTTGPDADPDTGPDTEPGTAAAAATVPLARRDTRPVVATAVLSTAAAAAFDVALTGHLSMFFDLCFVLVGLTAALVVHRRGFFAVGVLPPLLLGSVVAVLVLVAPAALTPTHLAFISTWLTGLAHHGAALVAAHAVVLAVIGARLSQRR